MKPFFDDAATRNPESPYFFIRYHEDGFHLRVRALCRSTEQRKQLEVALTRATKQWEAQLKDSDPVQLDRVESDIYQPEFTKYGGTQVMPYVENHFMESSDVALRIMLLCQKTGHKAEYISLWLLYESLQSLSLNPQEIMTVLNGYAKFWSGQLSAFQPDLEAQLAARYDANKQKLSIMFADAGLVAHFEKTHSALSDIKQSWLDSLKQVMRLARECELDGQIESDFVQHVELQQDKFAALPQIKTTPFSELVILPNLLHMLNNRIGVDVNKEAQLSFTICRYLSDKTGADDVGFNMILEPGSPGNVESNEPLNPIAQ